jgi:hypothetical protein
MNKLYFKIKNMCSENENTSQTKRKYLDITESTKGWYLDDISNSYY